MQERFFIDHGLIHDRKTGRHFVTDQFMLECNGQTLEGNCAVLNSLVPDAFRDLIGALEKVSPKALEQIKVDYAIYQEKVKARDEAFESLMAVLRQS